MPKGLRRSERNPFSGKIRIGWEGEDGTANDVVGTCNDVSDDGFSFLSPVRIPERTRVVFRVGLPAVNASGSVRYCLSRGIRYLVGIEFLGGFKWAEEKSAAEKGGE